MSPVADPTTHLEDGLLWEQPAWLAEVEGWIRERTERAGGSVTGSFEQVHVRWWSTVLRVPTTLGDLYFKAGASTQAFEPALVAELARVRPRCVPVLIAAAPELGWMLMRDGGTRLRELELTADEVLGRLEVLLPMYADLQLAVAPNAARLLSLGVPDLRLADLPAGFSGVLDDHERLLLDRDEGVTSAELERLVSAVPEVTAMCQELTSFGIPETIQHDDLHDGNILVSGDEAVVFDWGDSCVSHPLHTLVVTLRATAWKLGLEPGGAELLRLRSAYLEPFTSFGSHDELVVAADLAYRTGTLARALAWHRYLSAQEARFGGDDDAGAVAYGLKLFLADGPVGSWE